MKVCMKVQLTGTRNGEDWPAPGDILDAPADEAASLIDLGLAAASDSDDAPADDKPAGRKGARRATAEPA